MTSARRFRQFDLGDKSIDGIFDRSIVGAFGELQLSYACGVVCEWCQQVVASGRRQSALPLAFTLSTTVRAQRPPL